MPTAKQLLDLLEAFPWREWTLEKFGPGFEVIYTDLVRSAGKVAAGAAWNPKDPMLSRFMTKYVGDRIVQLEETTKAQVTALIRRVLDEGEGLSTRELGDLIGTAVREHFEDYAQFRADRIARTETAIATNHGRVLGLSHGGATHVEVLDNPDCEICAPAAGAKWTIDEALANPVGHPSCTRAFMPIDPDSKTAPSSDEAVGTP